MFSHFSRIILQAVVISIYFIRSPCVRVEFDQPGTDSGSGVTENETDDTENVNNTETDVSVTMPDNETVVQLKFVIKNNNKKDSSAGVGGGFL